MTPTRPVPVTFKRVMFGSLKDGGHLQIAQCVEYPEVMHINQKLNRTSQWEEWFEADGQKFTKLVDALNHIKAVPL